jgi:hypothetical protein
MENTEASKLNNKDVKKYKTSDIALAATLVIKNKELLYIEPIKNSGQFRSDIFHFVFKDTDDREQLVQWYSTNNDNLQVTPAAFRNTLRYLKEQTKNYNNRKDT